MSARVYSYDSGENLPGEPSAALVAESDAAAPTGAVEAYRDEFGVWQYVPADRARDYARMGCPCTTVYVSHA